MMQAVVNRRRVTVVVAVVALLVSVVWVGVAQRASAQTATPVVYVATGENFPDALGAASAAAVQGGPVLLVSKTSIPAETKTELLRLNPNVIYVAGGTAVVSDAVFNELKAYAPNVTRVWGANRYATAAKVSESAFPVTGGGGNTAALEAAVAALTTRLDAVEAENAELQALLAGVSRDGDILKFTGMNLQVVNGTGTTDGAPNSLGNIIVGYNEDEDDDAIRTGSHYLVVGVEHTYSRYGGAVLGYLNAATGSYASVTGGADNRASGAYASVTGGIENEAIGQYGSSVTGGRENIASGDWTSSVTGGQGNEANDDYAVVSGGSGNTASGNGSSVTGGGGNTADGHWSSVTGGSGNEVLGWYNGEAAGRYSSIIGGTGNSVVGGDDTVVGGDDLTTIGWDGAIAVGEGFWDAPDS